MKNLLSRAVKVALKKKDRRHHKIGAVGVRADGAIVTASNGPVRDGKFPPAHAEARLCRKLDRGAVVFIARANSRGAWRIAKPCTDCMRTMKRSGVKTVVFTISSGAYAVFHL